MNTHWTSFVDAVPWFLDRDQRVVVEPLAPPGKWRLSSDVAGIFPHLANLLGSAHTSRVSIDARDYVLFSWESDATIWAWLCARPSPSSALDLLPAHRALLASFGGIVERAEDPLETWLLNTEQSLTEDEARHDATFITDYGWAFEGVPGGIPIHLPDYYSISREANGNTTLCHRRSGDVLLFAPDHSFDDVEVLAGCPPYTLYRRRGATTFVAWVETVARQWALGLRGG